MRRIEKLTPEQEAELPAFRERWRDVGLSTDPIRPEKAREAVRALYRAGGREEPVAVIMLASPMACLLARRIVQALTRDHLSDNKRQILELKLRDQLRDQLWDQLRDQLRGQLGDQLGDQLRDQLWDQLRDQLWDQLGDQLRDQLWDQLRDQLWDQLRGQLGDQLGDQLDAQLWQEIYFIGGQDAFWLAFYEFGERIGVMYDKHTKRHFEAYRTYASTCGWMWAYYKIAFVCDRPSELHFDAQRRLHCAIGMAARFRDGWGVHAWHGLRIPERLISKTFSHENVEAETNVEFRRVMLEMEYGGRTGFELYLEARNAKVIAVDEMHGQPRRLLEVDIRGDRHRIIEVVNGSLEPDGSRRKFHLGAMPGDTPHDVVAASYGIAPTAYREAIRS
jgi:hypothetical protein